MAGSSATLHEAKEQLTEELIDRHRAIVSVMEELEAVDWYDQRVAATGDAELAAVLAHNRDEEKEHAVMVLEWLRRRDPALDAQLRKILFREGDIVAVGEGETEPAAGSAESGSLGIGCLRGKGR